MTLWCKTFFSFSNHVDQNTYLSPMDDAGSRLRHLDLSCGSRRRWRLFVVGHLLQVGLVDVVLRDPGTGILQRTDRRILNSHAPVWRRKKIQNNQKVALKCHQINVMSSCLRANHKGRKYNISDFHYFPTKQPRGAELGLFNTPQIVKESSCHHVSLG